MSGRIKASISISFWFLLVVALAVYVGGGSVIPLLTAVFIHESAHIIAIILCGYKIKSVDFTFKGIQIDISSNNKARLISELFISASGSLAGIVAALMFINLGAKEYYYTNIILSLFNLLPITGLDGGKIIFEIATSASPVYGCSISFIISLVTNLLLIALGTGVCIFYPNIGIFLIGAGLILLIGMISTNMPTNKK